MSSKSYNATENFLYVSGAEKNANKIDPLLFTLNEAGCNLWYDLKAPADTAEERIANCSYFMAYVTDAYVGSEKCLDEISYALQSGKKLLLIYGEDTELPKGIQLRLNRVQAMYRSNTPGLYQFYDKILQTDAVRACGGTFSKNEKGTRKIYPVEYDDTKTLVKSVLKIVGWFFVLCIVIMSVLIKAAGF